MGTNANYTKPQWVNLNLLIVREGAGLGRGDDAAQWVENREGCYPNVVFFSQLCSLLVGKITLQIKEA